MGIHSRVCIEKTTKFKIVQVTKRNKKRLSHSIDEIAFLVSGDYNTAFVTMTINPLVPSDTIAKQILDEMLEGQRD